MASFFSLCKLPLTGRARRSRENEYPFKTLYEPNWVIQVCMNPWPCRGSFSSSFATGASRNGFLQISRRSWMRANNSVNFSLQEQLWVTGCVTFSLNILTMIPWLWKRPRLVSCHGKAWFRLDRLLYQTTSREGQLNNSKVHIIVVFSTLLGNPIFIVTTFNSLNLFLVI